MTFLLKRMGWRVTALYLAMITLVAVVLGLFTDWFFSRIAPLGTSHLHHHAAATSYWQIVMAVALLLLVLWQLFLSRWFRALLRRGKNGFTTVAVPDMSCMVCQRKIHDKLSSLPGLAEVTVDLDRKEVCFADGQQREQVVTELQRLGYHPLEKGPKG